jgi:hypothetical protein
MPHKFNGTWRHFKLSEDFEPLPPQQGGDFILFINDQGAFDLYHSRVDGRKIRTASAEDEQSFFITAEDGRQYVGRLVRSVPEDPVMVIAGRYQDPPSPPKAKTEDAAQDAQDQGDWVLTKP